MTVLTQSYPQNSSLQLVDIKLWHQFMHNGSSYHNQGCYKLAQHNFNQAAQLSIELVNSDGVEPIKRLTTAHHNLAASYNAGLKPLLAESCLRKLYDTVVELCLGDRQPRTLRLQALAELDVVLFALLSHLGGHGKTDEVHQVLLATEAIAEQTANQLFN